MAQVFQTWDVRAKGQPPPPPPPSVRQQGRDSLFSLLDALGSSRLDDQRSPSPRFDNTLGHAASAASPFLLEMDAEVGTEVGANSPVPPLSSTWDGKERKEVIAQYALQQQRSSRGAGAENSVSPVEGGDTVEDPAMIPGAVLQIPDDAEEIWIEPQTAAEAATTTSPGVAVEMEVPAEVVPPPFPTAISQLGVRAGPSDVQEFAYNVEWSDGLTTMIQHSYVCAAVSMRTTLLAVAACL